MAGVLSLREWHLRSIYRDFPGQPKTMRSNIFVRRGGDERRKSPFAKLGSCTDSGFISFSAPHSFTSRLSSPSLAKLSLSLSRTRKALSFSLSVAQRAFLLFCSTTNPIDSLPLVKRIALSTKDLFRTTTFAATVALSTSSPSSAAYFASLTFPSLLHTQAPPADPAPRHIATVNTDQRRVD